MILDNFGGLNMDRMIFDFENNTIITETDEGTKEEKLPFLHKNRQAVYMAAHSFGIEDVEGMKELWQSFEKGEIDSEEFFKKSIEALQDEMKGVFPEELN